MNVGQLNLFVFCSLDVDFFSIAEELSDWWVIMDMALISLLLLNVI